MVCALVFETLEAGLSLVVVLSRVGPGWGEDRRCGAGRERLKAASPPPSCMPAIRSPKQENNKKETYTKNWVVTVLLDKLMFLKLVLSRTSTVWPLWRSCSSFPGRSGAFLRRAAGTGQLQWHTPAV